jgi:hypothetical protein
MHTDLSRAQDHREGDKNIHYITWNCVSLLPCNYIEKSMSKEIRRKIYLAAAFTLQFNNSY